MAGVVILGAGLTGLSAAYHLDCSNIPYQIFEKSDRPGGLLKSVSECGYTFDHTGHYLHVSDDGFKHFLDHTIGIAAFNIIQRRSAIFSHNVLTEYPFQMNLYGLPSDVIADCIEGFVKRHTRIKDPQNFHRWVLKHFGAAIGKHFFFPYNRKLLSYDLKKVHPAWTGRFVPSTSLQSIVEGCLPYKQNTTAGYNSSFFYPKQGGIERIIASIAKKITQPAHVNHEVVHIDAQSRRIHFANGASTTYTTLISTLPLNRLLGLLKEPAHTNVKQAQRHLLHNSVVNMNLGFDVPLHHDKHWIYFPEEIYPFYRLGFWHNVSASLVPPGHSAVYGEFSYLPQHHSAGTLQRMIDEARSKTLAFLGVGSHHKTVEKILHLEHAYVIYDNWRQQNLQPLLDQLQTLNIHSIGRYGAWKYSSMQEAYQDGKAVAAVLEKTHTSSMQVIQKGAQGGSRSAAFLP